MNLGYFQIIHHAGAGNQFPASNGTIAAISTQHMHANTDLPNRQEPFFQGVEGVFFVGVDGLTTSDSCFAMLCRSRSGQRQIDEIVVMVDLDMQHRLQFHLLRPGVIGPHLLAYLHGPDGLFAMCG